MVQKFNVYCDESCHLENDHQPIMVLGAVWCPLEKVREISNQIREIKRKHEISHVFEIKWTKISSGKVQFYLDLMDYFFENKDLHFRGLIVVEKSQLQHNIHNQNHDEWYYKMYFLLLRAILNPQANYQIYIDIKDTQGAKKLAKLRDVLSNNLLDFSRQIIEKLQTVRSHEVEILQLTDLLIGTISYVNRGLTSNKGKLALVERMRERSGYTLTKSTLVLENKVNLFCWQGSEVMP